ncbi:MAG: fibronectin type III domain-containing protein [Candidatus Thiodiazotropha sp.]
MAMKLLKLTFSILLLPLLFSCGGGGGGGDDEPGDGNSNRTVSLSWVAPTTRTDGSFMPLSSLMGYRVYVGTSEDDLQALLDVENASATGYTTEVLDPGAYLFAVSAYDVYGLESGLSNIVTKNVD